MNVIEYYSSANDNVASCKYKLYTKLQSSIGNQRNGDVNILMGDLNAEIILDDTGYEEIMGKCGFVVMC